MKCQRAPDNASTMLPQKQAQNRRPYVDPQTAQCTGASIFTSASIAKENKDLNAKEDQDPQIQADESRDSSSASPPPREVFVIDSNSSSSSLEAPAREPLTAPKRANKNLLHPSAAVAPGSRVVLKSYFAGNSGIGYDWNSESGMPPPDV